MGDERTVFGCVTFAILPFMNVNDTSDYIDAKHASRIAKCHVATIHRWADADFVRWKRRDNPTGRRKRLFVHRGDVVRKSAGRRPHFSRTVVFASLSDLMA